MGSYDALVAYGDPRDAPLADALQSTVRSVGRRWYKRRSVRLLPDDSVLAASSRSWSASEAALKESRYLILLASAESARSPWVTLEVVSWLRQNSIDRLLIALLDGELSWDSAANDFTWTRETPLPALLKGRFGSAPRWVDLRRSWKRARRTGGAKFEELGAEVAAAIDGASKQALLSRQARQRRQARAFGWSVAAGLLILLAGTAGWQWQRKLQAYGIELAVRMEEAQQGQFRQIKSAPADAVHRLLEFMK